MANSARADGSLYELVARGNKDTYFFKDTETSIYPFDTSYTGQIPSTKEIRKVPPKAAAEFGRTVDFDFDLVGDIMRNPTILIDLPTWLPTTFAENCWTSKITDLSGISYGYTNGIGYFLFEQIQFYQDNILLQEFSGDALWACAKGDGTYGQRFVISELTGQHDGSPLSISHNAFPKRLRLSIPLIGCQVSADNGFPQRAVIKHSYRLRCKLRRVEDLVEASDGRQKPNPWNIIFKSTTKSGQQIQFNTLSRSAMNPLLLQLETEQVYLPKEYQDKMDVLRVPFRRLYEIKFTQNQLDYLGVSKGSSSVINRRLEGCHPVGRILWFFRSITDINANQLWKVNNSLGNSYYNSLSLVIAGKTREFAQGPLIWKDITNFAKEDTDTGVEINTMNFGLGDIAKGRFPDFEGQATGSINFSTADKPTFYIDLSLSPKDPRTGAPNTELMVIVEGWTAFDTSGGRAELFSVN